MTTPVFDEESAIELLNNMADADIENLHNKTPPGIPEHRLRIKVGAVMMIIANLSVSQGLCNGTRVQILGNDNGQLLDYVITCRILTGTHAGELYDLHPIRFTFGGDPKAPHEGTVKCERIQFPLRPGMVLTFNKAQGTFFGFCYFFFYFNR